MKLIALPAIALTGLLGLTSCTSSDLVLACSAARLALQFAESSGENPERIAFLRAEVERFCGSLSPTEEAQANAIALDAAPVVEGVAGPVEPMPRP